MLLDAAQWQAGLESHAQRVEQLCGEDLRRRGHGIAHPVFDFLYDYYPARMNKWHPGVGYTLDAREQMPPHAQWKGYKLVDGVVSINRDQLTDALPYIHRLLSNITTNPAHFDCFGLHEWAMVYRTPKPRHALPLRLGAEGTNTVVETHAIRCTHYDAYRFFTPAARPLNLQELHREDQPEYDQRGCLHAAMDLYKWATKLGPLVPGSVLLDCFALARDVRILDMEASPYDCRSLGFSVVAIETAEGKAEYVRRQREFAERAAPLRAILIDCIEQVL